MFCGRQQICLAVWAQAVSALAYKLSNGLFTFTFTFTATSKSNQAGLPVMAVAESLDPLVPPWSHNARPAHLDSIWILSIDSPDLVGLE
jgi:hypothetical protein